MNHWKRAGWFLGGLVLILAIGWLIQSIMETPNEASLPQPAAAHVPRTAPPQPLPAPPSSAPSPSDVDFLEEPSPYLDTGLSFSLDPSTEYMAQSDIEFL